MVSTYVIHPPPKCRLLIVALVALLAIGAFLASSFVAAPAVVRAYQA